MDIITQIGDYLKEQKRPIPAVEIAERFLHIKYINPAVANDLVEKILTGVPAFYKTSDGTWTIKEPTLDKTGICLVVCKVYPEYANRYQLQRIYLDKFVTGEFLGTTELAVDYANLSSLRQQLTTTISDWPILFEGFGNQRSNFMWLLRQFGINEKDRPLFSLSRIIKRLFPDNTVSSADDMARLLLRTYQIDSPNAGFESFKSQVQQTMALLQDQDMSSIEALIRFDALQTKPVHFEQYAFDDKFLKSLPEAPGVYLMRDKSGCIIYVGKAKNLRQRVQQYFVATEQLDRKHAGIRERIYSIDTLDAGSELEALLMEYDLIQKYNPPFNQQLDVHRRSSSSFVHYPQIIFLSSMREHCVKVLFLKSDFYEMLDVSNNNNEIMQLRPKIQRLMQKSGAANAKVIPKIEIAQSWLSRHKNQVSSIDMRMITSVDEALRLVHQHIIHFENQKQVFY
jgi:hypothetical protein